MCDSSVSLGSLQKNRTLVSNVSRLVMIEGHEMSLVGDVVITTVVRRMHREVRLALPSSKTPVSIKPWLGNGVSELMSCRLLAARTVTKNKLQP